MQRQSGAAGTSSSRARRVAHRTRDSCAAVFANTLCSVILGVLLVAGVALFVVWLSLRPHRPRFSLASFSITGGQVAFNVSDRNPNRHIGVYYDATRAEVRFYDTLVAAGPAFADGWYQPNMSTVSITGLLDVVGPGTRDPSWPSFNAALHAGRLPLRLQLSTAIRFRVNVFHSGRQRMHVNCELVVGADGNLLPESVGVPCDRYF
ncbi:NDR1/HIN1-like protein 12 [Brachypodium distachyon]|uniref:Uncharacterized protein n=1 Tax=Brachypodium distachyon TaxID=15368 RepID=I1HP22_BRADI|nr:NDR1/HIN1-like protein 12 [Brachypodium distachyon]KQK08553.1 hypothetical protein BRADI_2g42460v3 [Brachypodium distachyon]|eukprot:XP_010233439.1 NDR1/HIN1-like protein 12 [Brachypodium distachyon]